MKWILFLSAFMLTALATQAQEPQKKLLVLGAQVVDGDTIPVVQLHDVNIYSFRPFKSAREARKMTRLMKNVKAAYPYARLAGIKLREYE